MNDFSFQHPQPSGNRLFEIIVCITLTMFMSAGLYLKTIKPIQRRIAAENAQAMQTRFVMEPTREKPKPKPKPAEKTPDAPIDLTAAPVLNQKIDDIIDEAPQPQQPVRRVYGLRRVYSTGLGSGGDVADAVIGKRGNTLNAPVDTVTATKDDLKGKLTSVTTITQAPRLKSNVEKPEYTKEMLDAHVEGVVKAELLIDADGLVKEVKILTDLGYGTADIARSVFMKMEFEPARRGTEPVAVWFSYSIRFEILEG
jgi:hypothetical protein